LHPILVELYKTRTDEASGESVRGWVQKTRKRVQ